MCQERKDLACSLSFPLPRLLEANVTRCEQRATPVVLHFLDIFLTAIDCEICPVSILISHSRFNSKIESHTHYLFGVAKLNLLTSYSRLCRV
jgi:hypothetical protein